MDQKIIFMICFIPIGLFWIVLEWDWKPASNLTGNTHKLVLWLLDYARQVSTTTTLLIGAAFFLASIYVFFHFDALKQKGILDVYFAAFFFSVVIESGIVFAYRVFLIRGREHGLLK